MFLSFLNTMLPNCRTADTTLSIATLTEKQGDDSQQYVGSRHEIFLESRCPVVWQAYIPSKTILTCILLILVYLLLYYCQSITTFKLETGQVDLCMQQFYSLKHFTFLKLHQITH